MASKKVKYLNLKVPFERSGSVDTFHRCRGARVLECGAFIRDELTESGEHVVVVQQTVPCHAVR